MNPDQLQDILAAHKRWLYGEPNGVRANLSGANLSGAILSGANLAHANLSNANLSNANLSGAILSSVNFSGVDFTNTGGFAIADDAPQRLQAVAQAALASDCALRMNFWHTCETTHCIAGWAIHQAGALGRMLEHAHGPEIAGLMLLGTEAHRYFYADNDQAREFLRSVLND